ncbi:protein kinase [Candidatus Uabimicrobium sp. HlEnr_7]|uniref:protein kinase domain-containing protein n=1 Tax=Candidatus Uabimicrobium helgolandensis TaxID=3095367 RepID=UPI003556E05B
MQKIETYNTLLAKEIKKYSLVSMDLLIDGLRHCNNEKMNLGEYLVYKEWISISNLAVAIQNIHHHIPDYLKIGKYAVLKELGRGGMGIVYLVARENSSRVLVLKTLLACSGDNIKRFYKEARAVAALQHPNIVPIYDFGENKDIPYFTMKHIEGVDFDAFLETHRHNTDACINVLIKISKTLKYIHEKNIIHRDIKPANILLDSNLNPYLVDFGLVKLAEHTSLTKDGDVLGTIHYTSPEQARGLMNISDKTDIYSMGVILYQILTGKTPFADYNMLAAYRKVAESIPPPPQKIDNSISDALNAICLKAMEKKPEKRYSAFELAVALEQYKTIPNFSFLQKFWRQHLIPHRNKLYIFLGITFLALFVMFFRKTENSKWYEQYVADSLVEEQRYTQLMNRAKQLTKDNLYDKALPLLQQYHQFNPRNMEVNYFLALCYEEQGKYTMAIKHISWCIEIAPWEGKYFLQRGEVYCKASMMNEAVRDFFHSMELEPRNIFIIERLYTIALDKASPKLLFLIKKLFEQDVFLKYSKPKIDLFQQQKNELCAEITQSKSRHSLPKEMPRIIILGLIDTFMKNNDSKLTMRAYKGMIVHPELSISCINSLIVSSTNEQVEKLTDLKNRIHKKHIKNIKNFVLQTIVGYIQAGEKKGLRHLYLWRQEAINILQEMIVSKENDVIVRYYALEVFFEVNLTAAYQFTHEILQNNSDLTLVLMSKTLMNKYAMKLNRYNKKQVITKNKKIIGIKINDKLVTIKIQGEVTSTRISEFIKVQALTYIDTKVLWQLITPKNPRQVRLQALERLLARSPKNTTLHETLRAFLISQDEAERGMAVSLLSHHMGYYELQLLESMDDTSSLVKIIAINKIKKGCSQAVFTKLREQLNDGDMFLRLHCVLSLASTGHYLRSILVDPNENILLRFATMAYFPGNKNVKASEISVARELLKDKDPIMRFFIAHRFTGRNFGSLASFAAMALVQKDYHSYMGVATSDNVSVAKKLHEFVRKNPHKEVQRIALVSLAVVSIQQGIEKITNFLKRNKTLEPLEFENFFSELSTLQKENSKMRKNIAFGCRYFLYRKFYLSRDSYSIRRLFSEYDSEYLQKLVKGAVTSDTFSLFQLDFLSKKAVILNDDRVCKLERSAVLYGLFKRNMSRESYKTAEIALKKIKNLRPLQKYWLASLYLYNSNYDLAKILVEEAVSSEPWNIRFLRLRREVDKKLLQRE